MSASDVRNVSFRKPPLGRRGYDEEEVDAFLDEVEKTITALTDEIAALRGQGRAPAPATHPSSATVAATDPSSAVLAELEEIKHRLARIEAAVAGRSPGRPGGGDPLFGS